MVWSLPTRLSFTSCWVMVEPPWATSPASELALMRPQDRAGRHAVVLVEVGVLDRQHGVAELLGHLVQGHHDAVLGASERAHGLPVAVEDRGALEEFGRVTLLDEVNDTASGTLVTAGRAGW